MNPTNVNGWGVDGSQENRPGVPMELENPRPVGAAGWMDPPAMTETPSVQPPGAGRANTPVYGTAIPPRGLSGMLRRLATPIPSYRKSRWMLLMMADRIDVIEHNLPKLATLGGAIALAIVAPMIFKKFT